MYGGVTEHNGNQLDKYRSITVRVFEDGKNLLSFDVQTNKKKVTAQELDYLTRHYLVKNKNSMNLTTRLMKRDILNL